MVSMPTEAEMEQFRREEYERGAKWQINWDTQAKTLKRAADKILSDYLACLSNTSGKGEEKFYDRRLIGIYYMLMGLAVENFFKGIIMVNRPGYYTPEGLDENIVKHETYEFLNHPDLKDLLKEFKKYEDILRELAEYVKWKARYPISKTYKDFDNIGDLINRKQLDELYNALSKRAWRERRPEILRNKDIKIRGEAISFLKFVEAQREIIDFRTPTTTMSEILATYPHYQKEIVISALTDFALEEMNEGTERRELLNQITQWELGRDDYPKT